MEYHKLIAGRILELCQIHDLTIGQLAARCHMNKATLDNIIEGKCKKPRIQTIYKIAGVFHLSVREFLDQNAAGYL
ncbi:MAG: helix-turn-helix transcriptional regulator [Oscillospiraceae bacterium]|nr:helix-turn-helix transcriptional regulator [Oscillospiraceae bacterium]